MIYGPELESLRSSARSRPHADCGLYLTSVAVRPATTAPQRRHPRDDRTATAAGWGDQPGAKNQFGTPMRRRSRSTRSRIRPRSHRSERFGAGFVQPGRPDRGV